MKKSKNYYSSYELPIGKYYMRKGFNFLFEDKEGNGIVLNLDEPILYLGKNEIYSKFLCSDRTIYCYNKKEKVFVKLTSKKLI